MATFKCFIGLSAFPSFDPGNQFMTQNILVKLFVSIHTYMKI